MQVLGYHPANDDGDIGERDPLCVDCADSDDDSIVQGAAIFSDTEADTPTHCSECGELIEHAVIDYEL